jgi:hypothetical protein
MKIFSRNFQTVSRMTLGRMTLIRMALIRMTLIRMTLGRITFCRMPKKSWWQLMTVIRYLFAIHGGILS